MFSKQARRHKQLMRIAAAVVLWKDNGASTDWDIDALIALFIGRVFAAHGETVTADAAAPYVTAALAKRGITLPTNA